MSQPAHVAVVGAGPAGAALAYLLARRGIRVTLIERQTDFAREFRGEVLMPSGIDAIRQIGLGAEFDALPQARPQAIDFHVHGRFVQRFALPDFMEDPPRMVSQPKLLEMLVAQGEACEGFRFVRGGTVADLIEEGGRTVGVRLRGDTLGADPCRPGGGLRRARLGGAPPRRAWTSRATRRVVRRDLVQGSVAAADRARRRACRRFCARVSSAWRCPAFDERLQVAWLIRKGSYGDLREARHRRLAGRHRRADRARDRCALDPASRRAGEPLRAWTWSATCSSAGPHRACC